MAQARKTAVKPPTPVTLKRSRVHTRATADPVEVTMADAEKIDGGKLAHTVIEARAWDGFTIHTDDGHPATLAVVDETGHIVESGPELVSELWAVAVLSYRRFLISEKALKVWSEPSGLFEERDKV